MNLSELEEYLHEEGRELLRNLLTAHLEERGVGDVGPEIMGADGMKRTHRYLRTKKIKTLFGEVETSRIGYSGRGAPSLLPLDGMLNLPSLAVSYGLQKYLVLEMIRSSFDESVKSVERWTGVRITKEQAEKIMIGSAGDFKKFYNSRSLRERNEAEALPLITLTSDGKGVVMRTEDLREATGEKAECGKRSKRDGHFMSKGNSNAKRMATVASVYEIARFAHKPEDMIREFLFTSHAGKKLRRPRPKAKRVWAGLENSGEDVISEIFEEALKRDPSNRKEWVVLVDGDPPEQPADESDEIIQMMVRGGLMQPRHSPPPDPISKKERRRLAEKLGRAPGRPLSEIIISERGQ